MNEALREWAFSLCLVCVIAQILRIINPNAAMQKIFKIVLSIFFLCCILSPIVIDFSSFNISVSDSESKAAEKAKKLVETTQNQATNEIKVIINKKLIEMGIKPIDIKINITSDGQSQTKISEIEIYLDDKLKSNHKNIYAKLKSEISVDVKIGYVKGAS